MHPFYDAIFGIYILVGKNCCHIDVGDDFSHLLFDKGLLLIEVELFVEFLCVARPLILNC